MPLSNQAAPTASRAIRKHPKECPGLLLAPRSGVTSAGLLSRPVGLAVLLPRSALALQALLVFLGLAIDLLAPSLVALALFL